MGSVSIGSGLALDPIIDPRSVGAEHLEIVFRDVTRPTNPARDSSTRILAVQSIITNRPLRYPPGKSAPWRDPPGWNR